MAYENWNQVVRDLSEVVLEYVNELDLSQLSTEADPETMSNRPEHLADDFCMWCALKRGEVLRKTRRDFIQRYVYIGDVYADLFEFVWDYIRETDHAGIGIEADEFPPNKHELQKDFLTYYAALT